MFEMLDPVVELNESEGMPSPAQSHHDPEKTVVAMESQHPRNWSSTRKTLLFTALMSSSLLADG